MKKITKKKLCRRVEETAVIARKPNGKATVAAIAPEENLPGFIRIAFENGQVVDLTPGLARSIGKALAELVLFTEPSIRVENWPCSI